MVTNRESQQAAASILDRIGMMARTVLAVRVARALTDGRGGVEMHAVDGRRITVVLAGDGQYEVQVARSGIGAGELRDTVLRMAGGSQR